MTSDVVDVLHEDFNAREIHIDSQCALNESSTPSPEFGIDNKLAISKAARDLPMLCCIIEVRVKRASACIRSVHLH